MTVIITRFIIYLFWKLKFLSIRVPGCSSNRLPWMVIFEFCIFFIISVLIISLLNCFLLLPHRGVEKSPRHFAKSPRHFLLPVPRLNSCFLAKASKPLALPRGSYFTRIFLFFTIFTPLCIFWSRCPLRLYHLSFIICPLSFRRSASLILVGSSMPS